MASLVALTPFLWSPAEMVAAAISTHFEGARDGTPPTVQKTLRDVAIVKITQAHFQSGYGSRSPLDRCVLASDLEQLFALTNLTVVAVDFDLAPYRLPQGTDEACQKKLDEVLDGFPRRADSKSLPPVLERSLILMQPMPRSDTPAGLQALADKWQTERADMGIKFAHVELRKKSGVAREFVERQDGQLALSLALRETLLGDAQLEPADLHEYPPRQIAVRGTEALYAMGDAVPLDKLCSTNNGIKVCIDLKAAIVGSGYSADDQHATMGGLRDGVDLHAAIAACPKAGASHFQHFLLDVVLGLFVGGVFSFQWKRYYETIGGTRQNQWAAWSHQPKARLARLCWWATPRRPVAAYGWFAWMLAFACMVLLAVSWLSLQLFGGACATAIFPAGIVIGMFIEVAIVQGPETAAHLMSHASADHKPGTRKAHPTCSLWPKSWHTVFKIGLVLAINVLAVTSIWH